MLKTSAEINKNLAYETKTKDYLWFVLSAVKCEAVLAHNVLDHLERKKKCMPVSVVDPKLFSDLVLVKFWIRILFA
jgi:hypothetical protein